MSSVDNIKYHDWETVGVIGRGNFGTVYEIQRDIFGDVEKAALKVIRIPQSSGDIDELYSDGYDEESISAICENHLRSIVSEYSFMRKVKNNSNIVHCDDVYYVEHTDEIGWDVYIKMELLMPIAKRQGEVYSDETVIKLALDMCSALSACEKHGIVHRDIKPQNIFVSEYGTYKLGDFGIAKTVEKTMGGTKVGTYKYMAPEVYYSKPYGKQADIYSLGLVLYWMMNERRMPFMPLPPEKPRAGAEEESRARRFAGEQLPPPKNGSDELKAIVLKACAYDPKDRYVNAQEMIDALNALRYGAVQPRTPVLQPENVVSHKEEKKEIIETVPVETVVEEPIEITEKLEAPSEPEPEEIPWELQDELCAEEHEETEQVKPKKHGKLWWKIAIPAALAVLLIVGLSIGLGGNATDGAQKEVPEFSWMSDNNAESVTTDEKTPIPNAFGETSNNVNDSNDVVYDDENLLPALADEYSNYSWCVINQTGNVVTVFCRPAYLDGCIYAIKHISAELGFEDDDIDTVVSAINEWVTWDGSGDGRGIDEYRSNDYMINVSVRTACGGVVINYTYLG